MSTASLQVVQLSYRHRQSPVDGPICGRGSRQARRHGFRPPSPQGPFRMRDDGFEARPRAGGVNSRRLTRWQLRDLARVASQARAAGDRAVKVHGVVIFFRHSEGAQPGCGQQRASAVVGDAPAASSAEPKQLSKRTQLDIWGGVLGGTIHPHRVVGVRLKGVVWALELAKGAARRPGGGGRVRPARPDDGPPRRARGSGVCERQVGKKAVRSRMGEGRDGHSF